MNQQDTSPATTMLPGSKPTQTSTNRSKTRQYHGFTGLIRGRYTADARRLDGRSALAQAVAECRADLLSSLGGPENLSAQEIRLVEMCAKDAIILEQVDTYLFQNGLINRRKRTAYPLTLQRMQIADSLTRRLQALGLSRRAKPVRSLSDILNGVDEPTPEAEPTDRHTPRD